MQRLASSYRDPAGYIFNHNNKVYRFIDPVYFEHYNLLNDSGLYKSLTESGRLVPHQLIVDPVLSAAFDNKGQIILPEQLPFISYPYEWSFDMWRDAALVTLKIAAAALEKGMILKDATPFNIQFYNGRPVFIDTLSFEKYIEGSTWVAYRQFCECFLGPLLLMHYCHRDTGKLFMAYPDGIPLDMIKELLPAKSKWNLHVYLHIWVQAKIAGKQDVKENRAVHFPKKKQELLLKGLIGFIEKLKPRRSASEWGNYYDETISGGKYLDEKKKIIDAFTSGSTYNRLIDLGANGGLFSLMLKDRAQHIIAADADSVCVNELYRTIRKEKIKNIIPLVAVLNNPSPALGWRNKERTDFTERLKGDMVLALALIHHLVISANLSLKDIAEWLADMTDNLIIEFVPHADAKVQLLLKNRSDKFPGYTEHNFRNAFAAYFTIIKAEQPEGTARIIFLMKKIK